jgi:hypothetical protein
MAVVSTSKTLIFKAIHAVPGIIVDASASKRPDSVCANPELQVAIVNPGRTFVDILRRFTGTFGQGRGSWARKRDGRAGVNKKHDNGGDQGCASDKCCAKNDLLLGLRQEHFQSFLLLQMLFHGVQLHSD